MRTLSLFTVSRAHNGWIVTLHDGFYTASRTILCLTWEEVEKVCREAAFPYPDPSDPRKP
jgi:hypothetical protein